MNSMRAGWLSWGQIVGFGGLVIRRIYTGRVLRVFGEILRQASLLITGSVGVVLGLVFVLGLQCGIEGAYGSAAVGPRNIAGPITPLGDLPDGTPHPVRHLVARK